MENTIGLRELRENTQSVTNKVKKGESFIVFKKSTPLFKVVPLKEDEQWETVIDFTKIKKGGIDIKDLLTRI